MRGKRIRRTKKHVSIDSDVLAYLNVLTEETGMDRSWTFNALVREYRRLREETQADSEAALPTPERELQIELPPSAFAARAPRFSSS